MANTKQKEILKKIRALPLRKYGSAKLQAPSNKHRPALILTQLKYINKLERENKK